MVICNKFPSSRSRIWLVAAILAVGVILLFVPRLGLIKENYKGFRLAKFNWKGRVESDISCILSKFKFKECQYGGLETKSVPNV